MITADEASASERLLAAILRLAPPDFRRRYGPELLLVYRHRLATRTAATRARFAVRELIGLCATLLLLQLLPLRRPSRTPTRRTTMIDSTGHHLRLALRTLVGNPGYTLASLGILGLGIGAAATIFTAVDGAFLRPLPFAEEKRLVALFETNPEFGWTDAAAAPANVLDWREQVEAFADVAMWSDFVQRITYLGDEQPKVLALSAVSGNFFEVLGVRPLHGRGFTWDETWQGRDSVVVLSHELWVQQFGADPAIVGRTLEGFSQPLEVVGVMPPGFRFPSPDTQLWSPFGWAPEDRDKVHFRRAHWVRPVARLAPDASLANVDAQLQAVVRQLQTEHPDTNAVMGAGLQPLRSFLSRDLRRPLVTLQGAALLLLLLACVSVANLTLVRLEERHRELGVRLALGAGRRRLAAQLLTESLLLSVAGGAIGLSVAVLSLRGLAAAEVVTRSGLLAAQIDGRLAAFCLLSGLGCGLLAGAAPALRAAATAILSSLRQRLAAAGGPPQRITGSLVALQVAIAVVLICGAGLMVRSLRNLRAVDPGFEATSVLAAELVLPSGRYPHRDQVLAFWDELSHRLEGRSGVVRVGTVGHLPLAGPSWSSQLKAAGWPDERVALEVLHRRADRGYFEALGIPLLRGRLFEDGDRPGGSPVVVVNETFAREHFPGEDPIGKLVAYDRVPNADSVWYEIVGIVGDQRQTSPGQPARAEVFENRSQDWSRRAWVVLAASGDPLSAAPPLRQVLAEMDPLLPVSSLVPLRQIWRASMATPSLILTLLVAFGAVAFTLAVAGVYGVAAQAARQRRREIGIRIAVGARVADVTALLLRRGAVTVAAGAGSGLIVALAGNRVLSALLYGVEPTDPLTLFLVVALLGAAGGVASYLPAQRASRGGAFESLRDQ